jgi:hypothetical protein
MLIQSLVLNLFHESIPVAHTRSFFTTNSVTSLEHKLAQSRSLDFARHSGDGSTSLTTHHSPLTIHHSLIDPVLRFLFNMFQLDFNFELITEMACQCFCCIHASVLAAGTAKIYHQAAKTASDIIFH